MNTETLSYEVGAYLGLPRVRRSGEAYQITKAILQTITTSLQRGESVRISGLGTFKIRTKPSTRSTCSDFQDTTPLNHYLKTVPARQYVHFTPSKAILRTLNATRVT